MQVIYEKKRGAGNFYVKDVNHIRDWVAMNYNLSVMVWNQNETWTNIRLDYIELSVSNPGYNHI